MADILQSIPIHRRQRPWSECRHLVRRSEIPVVGESDILQSCSIHRRQRPWSECKHLVRRSEKPAVGEEKIYSKAYLPIRPSPQILRSSCEYAYLPRRKQIPEKKDLQGFQRNKMPQTDQERIDMLRTMRVECQRGCMSRFQSQLMFKAENQFEKEEKETEDIWLPSSYKSPRSFSVLPHETRRYEDISGKIRGQIKSQKQPAGLHIPPGKEKPSTTFGGKCEPKPVFGKFTEAASKLSTHSLYFKMKHFPRFQYVYNLVKDCKSRVEQCEKRRVGMDKMYKNVNIEIMILGSFTDDDLNLLTKSAENKRMPKGKHIWKVQPLVCFENDFFPESNIKKNDLDRESTCHKILIKSDTFCEKRDKADDSIIIVEKNKEQIKEIITSCLEKPLHLMLQKWLEVLKTKCLSRLASGLIAEIEAIQKQMESCTIKDREVSHVLHRPGAGSIVPDDIIDFLFRRPGVHSFGIWWNSTFKVFVNETDEKRLRADLTKINPSFFTNYEIEIENGKLKDKLLYFMQGDEIQAKIPNKKSFNAGTLGGIVTKADDENKKYALTCHHLFPEVGDRAYTDKCEDIGACLYTTREKSCDFAAIEIEKSFSEKCDETFQNENREITNARVFSESVKNVGIVHKIGAATKVTKGIIISSEYYDKLFDDNNRGNVFLVKGIEGNFSEEGDSGSLVFTRSKDAQQACVDVLGMVYGNKVTVYDDNDDDDDDDDDDRLKCKNEDDNESLNASPSIESGDNAASNVKESENISSCYRIHTALELFKENQGDEVKFKDDLSLSSPSTSPEISSESDNSNEDASQ